MHIEYTGNLHCKIHHPSGAVLETDAPKDVGGKGEAFSPTDLLASSLASCIATTIALYAKRKGLDVSGMKIEVEKSMTDQPSRRIGKLQVVISIPQIFSSEEKQTLERVAHSCPVHHSLKSDIDIELNFLWK